MKRFVCHLLGLSVLVCLSLGCGDGTSDDPAANKQIEEQMEREIQEVQEQLPVNVD